jgi:hypothetical protein
MKALKYIPVIFLLGIVMNAQQQAGVNFSIRVMDFQSVSVENVIQQETDALSVSENNLIKIKSSSAYELQVSSYSNWESKVNNQSSYNSSLANSANSKDEIVDGLKKANYQNSKVVSASRSNLELYYDPSEISNGDGYVISYSVIPH